MKSRLATVNPATGELVREFEPHSASQIETKLQTASDRFRTYRRFPLTERARLLERAADLLEREKTEFGRLMTLEMGKPIRAAVQEAEKCAAGCRYYATHGARFLEEETVTSSGGRSSIRYQPLGPILAIMPWNFPFWQVIRFAAPALMAGNVALLKHASNVPQCALALDQLFERAGFPNGAFQTLLVGSDRVLRLIEDSRIKAVTLTGSVPAGESVASAAGRQIKKTVLELGGSDPFIVMPSAAATAVEAAVQARTINNGQSCIAAKRFIVHRQIADEFERHFIQRMAALRVGDPFDERTDIGPLATAEVRQGLQTQVQASVKAGARVLLGGEPLPGQGFFYPPTVLADAPPGCAARKEELFGPVATLIRVGSLEEALEVANETEFGLGSCLWSNQPAEQKFFVDEVEAGLAFINGVVASDPSVPFGGIKRSGYGRELSSHGLREFVNVKTVSWHALGETRPGAE